MPQADAYTFTGLAPTGYFAYTDLATEKMLIAEPGESYGMRATEPAFPVPPPDGRWTAAKAAPPSPAPSAKPAATIPAASEGAAA